MEARKRWSRKVAVRRAEVPVRGAEEEGSPRARRFSPAQKQQALALIAARMSRVEVAEVIGTTTESLRRWVAEAKAKGMMPAAPGGAAPAKAKPAPSTPVPATPTPMSRTAGRPRSPYAPADPAQGLGEQEVAAILELKKSHPSMGPAQLRAQLKRFKGWRLSNKAIARVLRGHGYEPVHRGQRPKGQEPTRFEAPRRNAIWQADFAEVRVGDERFHVLIVLDDFSRYVVGHALCDSPTSQVATETLRNAIARHGKPEAVRTDRGGGFIAYSKETDFARFLEAELIDHIVGRSYRPRGGGKVESAIGTLRRELWDVYQFADREEAERRLAEFFTEFNERRAHMGIDGLTPADRFFGRADRVLAAIDAISRRRQGALAMVSPAGSAVEEIGDPHGGAPLEVLRIAIVDGAMELRFCGARVPLGRVQI